MLKCRLNQTTTQVNKNESSDTTRITAAQRADFRERERFTADIRRRASGGAPIWYLVPDGVVQYINKYGLYSADDSTSTYDAGLPRGEAVEGSSAQGALDNVYVTEEEG